MINNAAEAETFVPADLLLSLNLISSPHQLHSPSLFLIQLTTAEIVSTPEVQVGHRQWNLENSISHCGQISDADGDDDCIMQNAVMSIYNLQCRQFVYIHEMPIDHHHHNRFTAFFPGPPG